MSKSICSVPLEGCFCCDCEPLPGSGCYDAWVKARLCWTVDDDVREAISHFLVWTCCSADTIRTLSAVDSKAAGFDESVADRAATCDSTISDVAEISHGDRSADLNVADDGPPAKVSQQDLSPVDSDAAAALEAAVSDAVQTGLPDVTVDDDDRVNSDEPARADSRKRETASLSNATAGSGPPTKISREDHSCTDTTVWRCLGLTPVTSFSIASRNLLDYRGNFSVQPILLSGAVLPHVSVVK